MTKLNATDIIKYNNSVFENYIKDLKNQYSQNSFNLYRQKITIFINWLSTVKISVSKFKITNVIEYVKLSFKASSGESKYIFISAVKNFTRWLNINDINNICSYKDITLPKTKTYDVKLYTKDEIKAIFNASRPFPQIHLILILAFYYGLSIEEITNIKLFETDFENNILTTNKRKQIFISEHVMLLLKIRTTSINNGDQKYLFDYNDKNKAMNIINKNILPQTPLKNISIKTINNMCIYNYIHLGMSIIEIQTYFNISLPTAQKLFKHYKDNTEHINKYIN